jgi:hypothetical protein
VRRDQPASILTPSLAAHREVRTEPKNRQGKFFINFSPAVSDKCGESDSGRDSKLLAMCAGRTGGSMKVARGARWGSLASCGGLAIRPPGVGAQPNFHERLSRVLSLRGCRAWIRMKMGLILWQSRLSPHWICRGRESV